MTPERKRGLEGEQSLFTTFWVMALWIRISSLHVQKAAEMKETESFFPDLEKMLWTRWRWEEASSLPGFSVQPLLGLEWRFAAHLYSSNPLPREAAIPKCLLLNIAPAFQTDRRAPAVYTRSWIFTSHTPNMVSLAAYQPGSPGERPALGSASSPTG